MIVTTTPNVEGHAITAYLGVDIDYEVIREGMMMVSASGTAVRLG